MTQSPLCRRLFLPLVLLFVCATSARGAELAFPVKAKRILFLGDSITHAGGYVGWIDLQLRIQQVEPLPEIINVGLGSETCSGLSEPDHPFPRPDVHERLDRALAQVKPDVVVACYGMNDGIYYPFGEDRFQAYQDGVNRLIEKVHATGAKLVLLTPPPFDPVPIRDKGKLKPAGEAKYAYFAMYENYDDVLARYGKWIMQQGERVEMVIDVHTPLSDYAKDKRKADPRFTLSPDGIHPNAQGHRILAETILSAWGVESFAEPEPALLKLMTQRTTLLHDAWLTSVGHKRPGVRAGLPLEEANRKADDLDVQAAAHVAKAQLPAFSRRKSTGGMIYQIHYPASVKPGELRLFVDYSLWIPEDVRHLRGVIVHQHGCGVGASTGGRTAADDLHWQALARKWNCALMGSSYEPRKGVNCRSWCDPRNGSDKRFLQALGDFANLAKHTELTTAPWCLWGHSGGGFWASLMQVKHPERIVAIWLRSGTAFPRWSDGTIEAPEIPAAAYEVPVMGNPGLKEKGHERFRTAWDGLTAMQKAYQAQGAFFEFAPDPNTGHECGDSRYLAIPYFDFWLQQRLPPAGAQTQTLKPIASARAKWKHAVGGQHDEYVRTGAVRDDTPPPAPLEVKAKRQADGSVTIDWNAHADFESGIRGFVIERDGKPLAQVPEKPLGRFGRPLFQTMSYHDTPEAPLPKMQFVDVNAPAGALPVYRVRTVNSAGLESGATASSR
ncbi:MAG: hypothetical protein CMJ48_08390 [Planctomycetaceae bacterium]|nr:hypothetical protein [Planctomycetaceae bacterium]